MVSFLLFLEKNFFSSLSNFLPFLLNNHLLKGLLSSFIVMKGLLGVKQKQLSCQIYVFSKIKRKFEKKKIVIYFVCTFLFSIYMCFSECTGGREGPNN